MFLPLWCRICFHRRSYLWTKLSCSVKQLMTIPILWQLLLLLTPMTVCLRMVVSIFFTEKIFLTLILFSSCGTKPIPSSGEVLIVSCATHIIEKYPLLPAYLLFWQNMSRAEGTVVSATLPSCTVLLKRRNNRSSHHINLLYRWQGLETWAKNSCFGFSISVEVQAAVHVFFFYRRALHSFVPRNFGIWLQQMYLTLDKEVKMMKGSIWRKAFAWATHCACLLMASWSFLLSPFFLWQRILNEFHVQITSLLCLW